MVNGTSGRNGTAADPNIGGELIDELGRFSMLPEYVMDHASHGAQALFARLRLMASNGEAWPGVQWLAVRLKVTDRTIRRWCQELRDLGVLTVEPRFRDDGSQTSNRYRLGAGPRTHRSAPPDMSVRPPRTSVSALELDQGELENPPTPRQAGGESVPDLPVRRQVAQVMDAWRERLHPRAKDTADRGRKVRQRLAEGYTVEELIEAIHGCAASEFHRQGAHTDITLICRDAAHVDRFRALHDQQRQQSSGARGASPAGPRLTPDEEALRDARAWLALHPDDADAQAAVVDLQRRLGTDAPTERSTTA